MEHPREEDRMQLTHIDRRTKEETPRRSYQTRSRDGSQVDADTLAEALRATLTGEVRFDAGSRALYATDGANYRQVPIGVVIPRTIEDVVQAVAVCRRLELPCCRAAEARAWQARHAMSPSSWISRST